MFFVLSFKCSFLNLKKKERSIKKRIEIGHENKSFNEILMKISYDY
jgi:hypothetical protein